MKENKLREFLKKVRYGAITALLAVFMAFPAYGQYGGSAGEIRNDFSIKASGECRHAQGTDVSYDRQKHWFYCRLCKAVTEYGDHSYSASLIKEPTCVANGIHKYSCSCGYEYDAPDVAALGHAWKNGFDYNETYHARFCSRCSAERERADHSLSWQEDGSQCWQGCSGCGYTRSRYGISLLYNIGTMAASDWWSQSNQIKVESRSVSIRPGTMLLVSADYRVDSSPFWFNIDFYPDEAGCETHLFGQTYRQHINWWTGTMPGYALQFRLFDNLNTACSPRNRVILENCRIYKVNTAAGAALLAWDEPYGIPQQMTATPFQAKRRTPSQADRKTPSQAHRGTPSQTGKRTSSRAGRRTPSQSHRSAGL